MSVSVSKLICVRTGIKLCVTLMKIEAQEKQMWVKITSLRKTGLKRSRGQGGLPRPSPALAYKINARALPLIITDNKSSSSSLSTFNESLLLLLLLLLLRGVAPSRSRVQLDSQL